MTTLPESWEVLCAALADEQEAGKVNSLPALTERSAQRDIIARHWRSIEAETSRLRNAIAALPPLPPWEQVHWAQTVSALLSLCYLEIDTTGLQEEDEMVRFTTVNLYGDVIDDWFIQPTNRVLSPEASMANGITTAQLTEKGLPLAEIWPKIREALTGRYVVSYSQEWDRRVLQRTAERHRLEPLVFIGECLQRRATQYYHREYSLTLEALCERVGRPLPAKPHQTSIDRARGQRELLLAFARAVTDVREPRSSANVPIRTASTDDWDPFLDSDQLP